MLLVARSNQIGVTQGTLRATKDVFHHPRGQFTRVRVLMAGMVPADQRLSARQRVFDAVAKRGSRADDLTALRQPLSSPRRRQSPRARRRCGGAGARRAWHRAAAGRLGAARVAAGLDPSFARLPGEASTPHASVVIRVARRPVGTDVVAPPVNVNDQPSGTGQAPMPGLRLHTGADVSIRGQAPGLITRLIEMLRYYGTRRGRR